MLLKMVLFHSFYAFFIFVVYINHVFLIQSSLDGYLACFHILAIVNRAAVSFQISVFIFQIYTQEWNCWIVW